MTKDNSSETISKIEVWNLSIEILNFFAFLPPNLRPEFLYFKR